MNKDNPNAIGITEGGDPALNHKWCDWVRVGRPAVLITKNPASVLRTLQTLSDKPNIVLHCGITGWGGSSWEPKVPNFLVSLEAYKEAIQWLGTERVVLRIDPILPSAEGEVKAELVKAHAVPNGRVRISFLDSYPHVLQRMAQRNIPTLTSPFHANREWRKQIWEKLGRPETCAEPDLPHTPCIGAVECSLFNVFPQANQHGQRPLCPCLANKVELLGGRSPCAHQCAYCYWKDTEATQPQLF